MCKVTTKRGENKKKSRKYYKIIPSRPYSMINELSICIIRAHLCILQESYFYPRRNIICASCGMPVCGISPLP